MSKDIVDSAEIDDIIALKQAFDNAIMPKVATALEIKRQELATKVFGDEEGEELEDLDSAEYSEEEDTNEED